MKYAPVTNATAQGFVKKSLEFASSANTSEVSSAVQLLEEYEKDFQLHRLYDMLPKPVEQQLVLEDRDGSAT